jgi:hypothetical protein
MIPLLIFYIHTIAAVWLFTKGWQDGDWKEGLLAVGFLALIFSVGWSMSTVILKLVMEERGFGIWIDRDALSLLLLAAMEAAFFYVQLRMKQSKAA